MEEKLTYTSAYNAGVLTAYNMGIINGDEFEELLIDVVPVPRLYEIIFDKTGDNRDKFRNMLAYMQSLSLHQKTKSKFQTR